MGKIIACIDSSAYADHVCHLSAWAYKRTGFAISLLHAVAPHSEPEAKADITGQIGLNAKTNLLKELVQLDEKRGKLELKKGQLMLDHAKQQLAASGIMQLEVLHRRGSLVEIITTLEMQAELIIMGKHGEYSSQNALNHLGSNLERVARAIHKPLLLASPSAKPVQKYLIAYDGSPPANKAVEFAAKHALLKGLECHLLKVGEETVQARKRLKQAEDKLKAAGINVQASFMQGKPVEAIVAGYVASNAIDLLVIGAYGHSKIRNLILGSTTTALIRKLEVPVLLCR